MSSAVVFDAVGAGYFGNGATTSSSSFNITVVTPGAYVIVAIVSDRASTLGAKWGGTGGTAMTLLGTINNNNDAGQFYGCLSYFGIANVAAGTTSVNVTAATSAWLCAQAVAYTGVGSISPATTKFGTGVTSVSQTVPALPTGCVAVQSFGFGCGTSAPGSTTAGFTSPTGSTNRTNERSIFPGNGNIFSALTLSDTTTGSTTFGATMLSAPRYSALTLTLAPAVNITTGTSDVQATGTVMRDNQSTGYGLATSGSTGTTVTWSQPLGPYASGIVVTVLGDYSSGGGSPPPGGNCPSYTAYTRTLTFNGQPMTLLAAVDFSPPGGIGPTGTDGWEEMWGISGAAVTGAAGTTGTLVLNEQFTGAPSTFLPELTCWSGSYSGVTDFGTPLTVDGNYPGTSIVPGSITSPTNHMVVGCFGSNLLSTPSGNLLYNRNVTGYGNWSILVQDSKGSPSGVSLSATSFAGYACGIAMDLIPGIAPPSATVAVTGSTPGVGFTVAPSTATVTFTGSTPSWTFSTSPFPPTATVSITTGTPDVSNPVTVAPAGATVTITTSTPFTGNVTTAAPTRALVSISTSTPTFTIVNSINVTPTGAAVSLTGGTPSFTVLVLIRPSSSTVTVTTGTSGVTGSTRLAAPTMAHVTVHGSIPGTFVASPNYVTPGERTVIALRAHRVLIPNRGDRTVIAAPTVY